MNRPPNYKKGILVVVSGFSGAGKGTIIKRLMSTYDNYALSISMTTRQPRENEIEGSDYFFVSKEMFEEQIEKQQLLEYASYCENYYGTPLSYAEEQMAKGMDVVLEIEIQGALKVKEKFPKAVLVFVMPPSAKELKNRLIGRGTESKEVIEKRLLRATEEASGIDQYDYILVNDNLDDCTNELHMILQGAKNVPLRNEEFIQSVRSELNELIQ